MKTLKLCRTRCGTCRFFGIELLNTYMMDSIVSIFENRKRANSLQPYCKWGSAQGQGHNIFYPDAINPEQRLKIMFERCCCFIQTLRLPSRVEWFSPFFDFWKPTHFCWSVIFLGTQFQKIDNIGTRGKVFIFKKSQGP